LIRQTTIGWEIWTEKETLRATRVWQKWQFGTNPPRYHSNGKGQTFPPNPVFTTV
jgi:hypothetical protein